MSISSYQEIESNFTYHPPTGNKPLVYDSIRKKAKELAHMLDNLCPYSRERSLAITKLEEAVMWANAAVARHGADDVPLVEEEPEQQF